jgi:hypothetical protein
MNIISIYYIYVLYVYTYPGVDNTEYVYIYVNGKKIIIVTSS